MHATAVIDLFPCAACLAATLACFFLSHFSCLQGDEAHVERLRDLLYNTDQLPSQQQVSDAWQLAANMMRTNECPWQQQLQGLGLLEALLSPPSSLSSGASPQARVMMQRPCTPTHLRLSRAALRASSSICSPTPPLRPWTSILPSCIRNWLPPS